MFSASAVKRAALLGGAVAFNPADIFGPSDVGCFYDLSDLSTLFQDRNGASSTTPAGVGDVLGSILDLSGNNRHAIAPADNSRPILRQDGALYYLEADGVDDFLDFSSFSPVTLIAAYRLAASVNILNYVMGGVQSGMHAGGTFDGGTNAGLFVDPAILTVAESIDTDPHVLVGVFDGASSLISIDNQTDVTGTLPAPSAVSRILGRPDVGTLDFTGDVFAILGINRVLAISERVNLVNWFAGKSGVTL